MSSSVMIMAPGFFGSNVDGNKTLRITSLAVVLELNSRQLQSSKVWYGTVSEVINSTITEPFKTRLSSLPDVKILITQDEHSVC